MSICKEKRESINFIQPDLGVLYLHVFSTEVIESKFLEYIASKVQKLADHSFYGFVILASSQSGRN